MSQTFDDVSGDGALCVLLGGLSGMRRAVDRPTKSGFALAEDRRVGLAVEEMPMQVCALLRSPRPCLLRWPTSYLGKMVRRWR